LNKNVHIVHFSSKPGGIEVLLPVLINNLKSYDFKSFVLRPHPENEASVYEKVFVNITYGKSNYLTYWKLFLYSRKNRKDIFHVFNIGPFALLSIRLAGVKKLVYGIHGTIYWKTKTQFFFRKSAWKVAMHFSYITTSNSVFSGEVFSEKVLKTKSPLLLYNPIDSDRFKKPETLNSRKNKIIYSGRLAKGKNLFKWIDIAGKIFKKFPDFRFELYGNGPLKQQLQDYIIVNNLGKIVVLKGHYSNVEEIYQNADLLIFLSEYESFGNVVVESILCGTPVIAGEISSMKEIFKNFPEFLVKLDKDLEYNILQKIEQIDSLRFSASKASVEFRERFSLFQHLSKVEKIYATFNS
jgi:glycosyltransferase involved in cell wall biosynthesis